MIQQPVRPANVLASSHYASYIQPMTTSSELLLVYITVRHMDDARALARLLVEKRLAAGVNIIPGVESIYHWQGHIHEHGECLLLAQTTVLRFPALERAVVEAHGYDVPCVVAMPLSCASLPFAQWIAHMTKPCVAASIEPAAITATTMITAPGSCPQPPTSILER